MPVAHWRVGACGNLNVARASLPVICIGNFHGQGCPWHLAGACPCAWSGARTAREGGENRGFGLCATMHPPLCSGAASRADGSGACNSPCPPSERGGVPLQNAARASGKLSPVPCFLSPVFSPCPPCLRENPYFFVPWCLGGSTPLSIADFGLKSRRARRSRPRSERGGVPLQNAARAKPSAGLCLPPFPHQFNIQNSAFKIGAAPRPLCGRPAFQLMLLPLCAGQNEKAPDLHPALPKEPNTTRNRVTPGGGAAGPARRGRPAGPPWARGRARCCCRRRRN